MYSMLYLYSLLLVYIFDEFNFFERKKNDLYKYLVLISNLKFKINKSLNEKEDH